MEPGFRSNAESWRYVTGPCSEGQQGGGQGATIKQTGRLARDGRVYLQAGAYGGTMAGSWGWGTMRMVAV
ncbi:hypothetical protein GCM10010344_76810 [Streptomyces bluensis]|nr:hypothetical protein GCM10010344_76810 [Streptomyces bluensis]